METILIMMMILAKTQYARDDDSCQKSLNRESQLCFSIGR